MAIRSVAKYNINGKRRIKCTISLYVCGNYCSVVGELRGGLKKGQMIFKHEK